MTRAIQQSVVFKSSPEKLYSLLMNSRLHSASTGATANISSNIGGKWSAFDGMIGGRNLLLAPNRMLVQAWRSHSWKKADPDSILIVRFEKVAGGTRVDLTHVGVPAYDQAGVTKGWRNYYWKPWKNYLATKNR
jgi:activator of HSP90 ATPase